MSQQPPQRLPEELESQLAHSRRLLSEVQELAAQTAELARHHAELARQHAELMEALRRINHRQG